MAITESQLKLPTLKIAAARPNGFITTSQLIIELKNVMNPTGQENAILQNRNDTKFSQKVRNLVSHRDGRRSLFSLGYLEYDELREGVRITEAGLKYLENF